MRINVLWCWDLSYGSGWISCGADFQSLDPASVKLQSLYSQASFVGQRHCGFNGAGEVSYEGKENFFRWVRPIL